jgi:hypothetical protein
MEEIWKAVEGYEGIYEVSNLGQVRSLDRVVEQVINGTHCKRRLKGRILATSGQSQGYNLIGLNNKGHKTHYVHTLVATAFHGPRPEGMECRHLDGNGFNNKEDNLEWSSHQTNMDDLKKHGTLIFGENHHQTSLTSEDIVQIRLAYPFLKAPKLAKRYGVSTNTIYRIVTREYWKHVP